MTLKINYSKHVTVSKRTTTADFEAETDDNAGDGSIGDHQLECMDILCAMRVPDIKERLKNICDLTEVAPMIGPGVERNSAESYMPWASWWRGVFGPQWLIGMTTLRSQRSPASEESAKDLSTRRSRRAGWHGTYTRQWLVCPEVTGRHRDGASYASGRSAGDVRDFHHGKLAAM